MHILNRNHGCLFCSHFHLGTTMPQGTRTIPRRLPARNRQLWKESFHATGGRSSRLNCDAVSTQHAQFATWDPCFHPILSLTSGMLEREIKVEPIFPLLLFMIKRSMLHTCVNITTHFPKTISNVCNGAIFPSTSVCDISNNTIYRRRPTCTI